VELQETGVVTYTAEPGFVAYGAALEQALLKFPDVPVRPPEAIGAAIVWLVTSPEASRLRNKRIHLPAITHRCGLLPGWGGPGSPYRRDPPGGENTNESTGGQAPDTARADSANG